MSARSTVIVPFMPYDVQPGAITSFLTRTSTPMRLNWFFVTEQDVDGLVIEQLDIFPNLVIIPPGPTAMPVAAALYQVRDFADVLNLRDEPALERALDRWRLSHFGVVQRDREVRCRVRNDADKAKRFSAVLVGEGIPCVPF